VFFGNRVPGVLLVLVATVFLVSVVAAVGGRNGFPLYAWGAANPGDILTGQLWRLFTWEFFESEPLALLFACFIFLTLGIDLALRWGRVRFVLNFLGLSAIVAALVTALSLVYRPLGAMYFSGTWPIQEAFIILWAAYYPSRQLRLFFLVSVAGRQLIYLTVAITALFSLFYGFATFVPHFVAEALAIVIAFAPTPRNLWLEAKLRGLEKQRRATHLKSVPRSVSDDDEPPTGGRWLN
jgi:hypothetical protein